MWLSKKIRKWKRISLWKYFYYNFLCSQIQRDPNCRIIPYKNCVLDLHKTARIYLRGQNLHLGFNKLRGSKSETLIRLERDAVWNCNNGAILTYNTVLEVKDGAVLDTGFFSANGGSVIIADQHITLGEDVMLGRNVIIYDSDFHQLCSPRGEPLNPPEDVVIGDHVWLTSNIIISKGTVIGPGSLVTALTYINNKELPAHSIITTKVPVKVRPSIVSWRRDRCPRRNNPAATKAGKP